jgi:hypothetical protein
LAKIETAYGILSEAQDELKSAFSCGGKFDTDFGVLPDRNHVTQNADAGSLKEVKEVIKRKAWRNLYASLEIDRIASIKRRDEIYKMLESGELPEITIESVFEIFEALNQNMNTFANESVLEVYKWLRPATDGWEMSKYKTNQKNATFELGKKVVKSRMVENKYSGAGFHVNHYNEKYLLALDKVFHMLDGKSMMQSYRSPLVDAINTSEGGEVVTEYFKVKMYRNCNAHIEFLRQNLVDEFNKICGGMNLKPFNS